MGSDPWQSEDSLKELSEKPYRYSFYSAMRLLECSASSSPRLGESAKPTEEIVRLGQRPSMKFASSTIASVKWESANQKWYVDCKFLGLFGPHGAFPIQFTEYAMARARDFRDETFQRFTDCFSHRLLSFFYRAYASVEPTIQFDRPKDDRFSSYVGSLMGIGTEELQDRDSLNDLTKLFYAGHFSQQNHHADGLQSILTDYFSVPIDVEQFVGNWLTIPETNQLLLGRSPETGALGKTTSIGSKVWECQQCIRVNLGPIPMDKYQAFLPGGACLTILADIIKNYSGLVLDWQAKVILEKKDVPQMQLGSNIQVGWVSWLNRCPPDEDPQDLVLHSEKMA
jgi:type VI secretion system protein ImpH